MLISPWIPKGTVIQEPKGPYNTSQFELTSVPATVKTLFNLSGAQANTHTHTHTNTRASYFLSNSL